MDQKMKSGMNLKNLDEFSPDVIQKNDIQSHSTLVPGSFPPSHLHHFSSHVPVYHLSPGDDLCPSITDRCIFILFMCRSPSLPLIAAADTEA